MHTPVHMECTEVWDGPLHIRLGNLLIFITLERYYLAKFNKL